MEWQLSDNRKEQYSGMLKAAQDLEITIGSNQYRLYKLLEMRSELDGTLKKWWEEILKEMNLDITKDYMITKDGAIKEIEKENVPAKSSAVGTNAAELK